MTTATQARLDNINLRETTPYESDDMIAYVSVTGFLAMTILLLVVVSL
jgi:hypothetical protein